MTIELFNNICSELKTIVTGTMFENHVFCVGGCIRDEILGSEIKDIDLAVDMKNGGIEFAEWLFRKKYLVRKPITYPTYSTAMFHLKKFPDIELEAVQTRKEKYEDKTNRNPVTAFGTIYEDCMRRDLTINSLYKNVTTGEILDLTGLGVSDIKDRIIRTPVDPNSTFDDDPLRMMRCIRFASRYNWKIQEDTWNGITENSERLSIITAERIQDELNKILSCSYPDYAMKLLCESSLSGHVFDIAYENIPCFRNKDYYDNVISNISKLESDEHLDRLAFILFNIGRMDDCVEHVMSRLKYSNADISYVRKLVDTASLVSNEWNFVSDTPSSKAINMIEHFSKSLHVYTTALNIVEISTECKYAPDMLKTLYKVSPRVSRQFFDYQLPVNGNEIMMILNIKPGPKVREIINYLTDVAYEHPLYDKDDFIKILLTEFENESGNKKSV